MFVIFLVLFGLLQVFYFVIGQYFIDYAAIRGARSRAVGFRDYLIGREVRVMPFPPREISFPRLWTRIPPRTG